MLVTHDMLKKSTPVCIAFNHMPWHYLAVARLDIGGQRKHFIWLTNFKKRFEWDGSFSRENEDGTRTTVRVRAANQTVAREALSQTFLNRATLCTVQDGERYEL